MVTALVKDGGQIIQELSGEDANLWHMSFALGIEIGELCDPIKKYLIYRKELDIENVKEEFGDIYFYLEGLHQALGITREECLEANINKLAKRYEGFKYSDQAAIERKDKAND